MNELTELLDELESQRTALVHNLANKGVSASEDEGFTTLVPKVLDVQGGGVDEGIVSDILMGNIIDYYRNDDITSLVVMIKAKTLACPNAKGNMPNNSWAYQTAYCHNILLGYTKGGISSFMHNSGAGASASFGTAVFTNMTETAQNFMNSLGYERIIFCKKMNFLNTSSMYDLRRLKTLVLMSDTMCTCSPHANFLAGSLIKSKAEGAYIYVPRALVSEYESNETWASKDVNFRAIEDYPEVAEYESIFARPE